jgi:hypothetical protein
VVTVLINVPGQSDSPVFWAVVTPHFLENKGMWQSHLATGLSDFATWRSDLAESLVLRKETATAGRYSKRALERTATRKSYLRLWRLAGG